MRIVIAVKQIPYRLESQEQTFFEALAQCGRDNRFNFPFGAYRKKRSVDGTVIVKEKGFRQTLIEDKKGERNSGAKLQSNEAHSGAWIVK